MTDKYYYWLSQQAARDETLFKLAMIAMSLVLAWELLRFAPRSWIATIQRLYLIGGAVLFVAGLLLTYFTLGAQP